MDPLTGSYPWYTPYQFAGNTPIRAIDLDGLEEHIVTGKDGGIGYTYGPYSNDQNAQSAVNENSEQFKVANTLSEVVITPNKLGAQDLALAVGYAIGEVQWQEKLLEVRSNSDGDWGAIAGTMVLYDKMGGGFMARSSIGRVQVAKLKPNSIKFEAFNKNKLSKIQMQTLRGGASGPVAGVIEVSPLSKSVKAFQNYNRKGGIEFVFDPTTNTFAVGSTSRFSGSPHQQLARSIGADQRTVLGGMFKRDDLGRVLTNEHSGHFWKNWTPENRIQFEKFMESKTGEKIFHNIQPPKLME